MDTSQHVYCSTTEFKAQLRRYKDLARTHFVHVLEHGRSGYILVSRELYEAHKAEIRHRAEWQVDAEEACWHGWRDAMSPCDAMYKTTIEYLGEPLSARCLVTQSFDDDVRRHDLASTELDLVRSHIAMLAERPRMGRKIDWNKDLLAKDNPLPPDTQPYRMTVGPFDIIYGVTDGENVQAYGLIDAL